MSQKSSETQRLKGRIRELEAALERSCAETVEAQEQIVKWMDKYGVLSDEINRRKSGLPVIALLVEAGIKTAKPDSMAFHLLQTMAKSIAEMRRFNGGDELPKGETGKWTVEPGKLDPHWKPAVNEGSATFAVAK